MTENLAGGESGYIEGASVSPNELHIQYGIPVEEIGSFRSLIRIYPGREAIIREGEQERALYLLRVGSVDVFKGGGASRENIGTIEAVNFFGEMSLINDEPRSATIVARSEYAVVYRIPNPNIQTILTNTKWTELLLSRLSRNLAKSLKQQLALSDELRAVRVELDQARLTAKAERAESERRTRLALNGILHFQTIVQRTAVVGSKGWAYLNALKVISHNLILHYLPNLGDADKTVEVNVIKQMLAALPQDEKNKIIDELKQMF